MSRTYEVEVLLRPAVEIYAAIVSFAAAALIVTLPHTLFMPESVAYGAAVVLVGLGVVDSWRAVRVWRYRWGMRRSSIYSLDFAQLPYRADELFIGRGFEWTPQHTQRLADTYEARYAPFLKGAGQDNFGGNPKIHAVELCDGLTYMPDEARRGGVLIIGTTGAGKGRVGELMASQDIAKPNDVVIYVDPKGDGDLLRRLFIEAERHGRQEHFHFFHLGFPEASERYNAIGNFSRISEIATRIANQLPSEGNAAAFREFAWRFLNIAARVLNALGERPAYPQLQAAIDDIEPLMLRYMGRYFQTHSEVWEKRLSRLRKQIKEADLPRNFASRSVECYIHYKTYVDHRSEIADPLMSGLAACIKYDRTYYDKLVSSVGPLLEKLTAGKAGELLAPDYQDLADERPIFDWRQIIRQRGIVYIGLDALSDSTVSGAVGQSMLADLASVAGEIYKHGAFAGTPEADQEQTPQIWLHLDEMHELIGDEFLPLVNKCRGAGMNVTAYTQAMQDIESRLGSRAKAEQIIGNFNSLFLMRVRNRTTAELLTEQLPEVNVLQLTAVTSARSGDYASETHFTSTNEDRITSTKTRMLDPSTVMQLPNGHAFGLIRGGRLVKLRCPLPIKTTREAVIPAQLDRIVAHMREQIVPEDWAEEEPWWQQAA